MKKILLALGLGVILQWLSIFGSYRLLPHFYDDIIDLEPIATSGFPFKTFEYPFPPMGNNWPPSDVWPAFFMNLIFWIIVGIIITLQFGNKLESKKVLIKIVVVAIFLSMIGIIHLRLKFD